MDWHNASVHLGDHVCVFGCTFELSALSRGDLAAIGAPQRMKQVSLLSMVCLFLGIPLPKFSKKMTSLAVPNDVAELKLICMNGF